MYLTAIIIIRIVPNNCITHAHTRILVDDMEEFKGCANEVVRHIPSMFTKEMSQVSEVVSVIRHLSPLLLLEGLAAIYSVPAFLVAVGPISAFNELAIYNLSDLAASKESQPLL